MAKKVSYGLSNVAYALVTETTTSGVTTSSYGSIKDLKGAVSLSLSNNSSKSVFRADNSDFFVSYGQGGFDGTLEIARVNEDFMKDVLGYVEDNDKILVESSASFQQTIYFALLFQFENDQGNTLHCLYKCSASHPDIASSTTGENGQIDPQTATLNISCGPRADADKYIHLQTQESTSTAVVEAWYTAVPTPTFT